MKQRFKALDGMRGICAISVVLYHCHMIFGLPVFFQDAYLAVDVFFILSGFVIAFTYEERRLSGFTFPAFMRARALRLLPAYWLGVLFSALVFTVFALPMLGKPFSAPLLIELSLLAAFLLPLAGIPNESLFPTIGSAWSLFCEEIVNVLYGAWMFRLGTRWLLGIAATCWIALVFSHQPWSQGWKVYDFWVGVLRAGGGFFTGVAIARFHGSKKLDLLPVVRPQIIFGVWLAVAMLPTLGNAFEALIVAGIFPFLIMLLIRSEAGAPPYCEALGAISYPLYVTHQAILHLLEVRPMVRPGFVSAIVVTALCILIASMAYNIVRDGRRLLSGKASSEREILSASR